MDASQVSTLHLAGEGVLQKELTHLGILIVLIIFAIIWTRRHGYLSIPTLLGIGGFSIFWQEFYADWGAYLLWSDKYHVFPFWGPTMWTTPIKPIDVLSAYPVFFVVAFSLMLALTRRAVAKFKNTSPLLVCLLTAGPLLALINLGLEYVSVAKSGQWTYVEVLGPAITTIKGQQPLLTQNIPFGIFGAVLCYLILKQDDQGKPTFERITHPERASTAWGREVRRAFAWVIVWNLCYWFLLCTPLIAIRLMFGPPSALVP